MYMGTRTGIEPERDFAPIRPRRRGVFYRITRYPVSCTRSYSHASRGASCHRRPIRVVHVKPFALTALPRTIIHENTVRRN